MPSVKKSALVMHKASEMYHLVDDIELYPEFLPWCKSTTIIERDEDHAKASIEIAVGAVNKSFTTVNRTQKNKMIEIRLVEGPFKHLQGFWQFDALEENASKISVDMEFEYSSRMMGMVIGPVFGKIVDGLIDAFCKRADQVYRNG
ncbi:MAG TPA: type II toxin-antitoxin system RatA family toxin [Gammaproteobacteria bacterium]|nr:type II toxin-antitoxin system RatA family toxin [Gammaproteobacteria bacterium]